MYTVTCNTTLRPRAKGDKAAINHLIKLRGSVFSFISHRCSLSTPHQQISQVQPLTQGTTLAANFNITLPCLPQPKWYMKDISQEWASAVEIVLLASAWLCFSGSLIGHDGSAGKDTAQVFTRGVEAQIHFPLRKLEPRTLWAPWAIWLVNKFATHLPAWRKVFCRSDLLWSTGQ